MSLRTIVLILTVAIVSIAFAGVGLYFMRSVAAYSQDTAVRAVETRGQALAQSFASTLEGEWGRVRRFAESVDVDADPTLLQAQVDGFSRTDERLSWAGLVGPDGTVIAATDALLVDVDVSQRPWFQRGLEGAFAGDVHEAVLLADLLSPGAAETPRFVDFAAPVRDGAGRVAGVFGTHINWTWVRTELSVAADTLGLDAVLINRSGEVLLATFDPGGDVRQVASVRAAPLGTGGSFFGRWPDGNDYFSFAVPEVVYGDLPSFGWSIVARLDSSFIENAQESFNRSMLVGGGLMLLGAFLALGLIVSMVFRPLVALVDTVSRLSKGEDVGYVEEAGGYREARRLSNAIARLQSRRENA